MSEFLVRPIGFVHSPFREKADAPRQAVLAKGVCATLELLPEHEDALDDLEGFDRIWVVFWFDRAAPSGMTKVLPPRSRKKRGVFATRSPHRPNPIGISAVRLERVEGRVLHLTGVDFLDGTPVLDVKPYIAYADAFPDASLGWLAESDQGPVWSVEFGTIAAEQLAWLATTGVSVDLRPRIAETLALGPQPHAYRRIRRFGDAFVLAVKEWRVAFSVRGSIVHVDRIHSGYRPRELAIGRSDVHDVHRRFVARFGTGDAHTESRKSPSGSKTRS